MFRLPAKTLRAAAFTISALLATTVAAPATAQVSLSVSIGFDNFHNRLAPYGTWSNNARWGEVWRPRAGRGFKPYYNGHWEDTQEYGWLWVSQDSWGDLPYHYGRWVNDPREGWLWVPGYVWGPSWVVWREGGGNIGWFPMPPGDDYYGDGAYRDDFDNQYGYRDWYGPSFSNDQFISLWTFVGEDHFRDRNFRNYAVPQRDYGRFFQQTRNTTNYVTVNNYIVNRSVDERRFSGTRNQQFQPVPARSVIGGDVPATQTDIGRQVEQRERQRRPIPASINPAEQRGRGNFNSNAQPPNGNPSPQDSTGRGDGRGRDANGPGRPTVPNGGAAATVPAIPPAPPAGPPRQNDRGRADINPAEQRGRASLNPNAPPNGNSSPQDRAGRGNDRGRDANGPNRQDVPPGGAATAVPASPAAPDAGPSRQNDRGRANLNPPEQRGRAAPAITAAPSKDNAAPPGLVERGNRHPAPEIKPTAGNGGQGNPSAERGTPSPRPREVAQPDAKVIVKDTRTPPSRARENTPATEGRGNARNNQARGNREGDTNNAGNPKPADDKKDRPDRGRN